MLTLSPLNLKPLTMPAVGFTGNNPISSSTIDLTSYRQDLVDFPEDGIKKTFTLPEIEKMPGCLREQFKEAIKTVSPERFHELIVKHGATNDVFGIAEEATDLMYYCAVKAALDSDVVSKEKLENFKNRPDVRPLLNQTDERSIELIREKAGQEIQKTPPEKFEAMKEFFPKNTGEDISQTIKDFAEMVYVDYAVQMHQKRPRADIAHADVITLQLNNESAELFEHMEDVEKPKLPDVGEKKPDLVAKFLEKLVDITSEKLNTKSTSVDAFLKYQLIKSSGRTEELYKNPPSYEALTNEAAAEEAYKNVKQTTKSWEKIFEAEMFLQEV